MNILYVYPSLNCTNHCKFCYNLNASIPLKIEDLDTFLSKYNNKFDKVIISGGEPDQLNKEYFNTVADTIKKYFETVYVQTYPTTINNYREDLEYILTYDFLSRPFSNDAWKNILNFPKQFDLQMMLSPTMVKYHPNAIFRKLSLLNNLRSVEFTNYIGSDVNEKVSRLITDFIRIISICRLNIKYSIINREKLNNPNIDTSVNNFYLLPGGVLKFERFINLDRTTIEINPDEIDEYKENLPDIFNLYNDTIKEKVKCKNL